MGKGDLKIKQLLDWLEKIVQPLKESKKRATYVAIAFVGIALILFANMFFKEKEDRELLDENVVSIEEDEPIEEVSLLTNVSEIEESYEKDLQAMLNKIKGVSEVEVMVNVDSTNVHVYEKDLIVGSQTTKETDQNGGVRDVEDETKETKLVYVREGDQEVPILVQTKKPEVRGVFIIARGVDNATTKQWVVESVSKVLDVPSYRISVMPK